MIMVEKDSQSLTAGDNLGIAKAIDSVFLQNEQTITELRNSFLYLKNANPRESNDHISCHAKATCHDTLIANASEASSHEQYNSTEMETPNSDNDSLLEEQLGSGSVLPPVLCRSNEENSNRLPKFDNFMEDDLSGVELESDNEQDYDPREESTVESDVSPNSQRQRGNINISEQGRLSSDRIIQHPPTAEDKALCSGDVGQHSFSHLDTLDNKREQLFPFNGYSDLKVIYLNTLSEGDPLPGEVLESDHQGEQGDPLYESASWQSTEVHGVRDWRNFNIEPIAQESDEYYDYTAVEEFHLDKNFDYDNVACTPKFDLTFLKNRLESSTKFEASLKPNSC